MKTAACFLILLMLHLPGVAQKTLLIEKIGKKTKYYYHTGDKIKLKSSSSNNRLKGELIVISDSSIT